MAELKSNTEWKQWGKEDPLYGVASWADKHKYGASPWTEEAFYALGESDWQDFLRHWEHYGLDKQSCLEIGCGAGRLTKQIANTFYDVYAADVSEDMIAHARNAVGKANVTFSVIDGLHLPNSDGSVKAIFSAHVLQHLDNTQVGLSYFREFYRVLSAGGTIMIHLPLYQFPTESGIFRSLMSSQYTVFRAIVSLKAAIQRGLGLKLMRGTPYSIQTLTSALTKIGFTRIEFQIFPTKSNGNNHSFVLASK